MCLSVRGGGEVVPTQPVGGQFWWPPAVLPQDNEWGGRHELDQGPGVYSPGHESPRSLHQTTRQAVDRVLRKHIAWVRQDRATRAQHTVQGQFKVIVVMIRRIGAFSRFAVILFCGGFVVMLINLIFNVVCVPSYCFAVMSKFYFNQTCLKLN